MDETFEIGNGNYVRVDPTGGATIYNEDNIVPLNERQTAALLEVLKCSVPQRTVKP